MLKIEELTLFQFIDLVLVCFFLISRVAAAPFEEYALAKVALEEARKSKAQRFSSYYYQQAHSYFKRGEVSFKKKDFNKAQRYFKKSQELSEQAEDISYIKISTDGGILH